MIDKEARQIASLINRSLVSCGLASPTKTGVDIKTDYVESASAVTKYLLFVKKISSRNWLNHKHLFRWLCSIWREPSSTITLTSIMCPTYKKDGSAGLNDQLGRTSKVGLQNIKNFFTHSQNCLSGQFKIQLQVFFGNLSVERYSDLPESNWKLMLKRNLALINREAKEIGLNTTIIATDSIKPLYKQIGYEGQNNAELTRRNKQTESIYLRNRSFYVDKLGWPEDKADARTANSITTYSVLGEYLTSTLINPIFFYTANSYEKASAYNLSTLKPLFIIYPRKDASGNIEEIPAE